MGIHRPLMRPYVAETPDATVAFAPVTGAAVPIPAG